MMRFPPQVIQGPAFYQMFYDCPLLVDNPYLTQDNVGHTKSIVMVPKHFMGILIGHNGSTIKYLMDKYNVHTQTWKMGHVFVDSETYNLPVIWATPKPCFIIFGLPQDVFAILTEFCELIWNTKHIRYYSTHNAFKDKNTIDLYKIQCQKKAYYTDQVNLSLSRNHLTKKINRRISEYLSEMESEKVTNFIYTQFDRKDIATFLRDEDQLVSVITDAKFILDSENELTLDNLQQVRDYDTKLDKFSKSLEKVHSDDMNTYELTEDEQYEGEKFIFENQMCNADN